VSSTSTIMSTVPDLDGLPPSKAVNTKWMSGSFSRSKAFFSNNSIDLPLSEEVCTSTLKKSLVLRV
uniref:Uncharacterized protein n=1 Tax=Erpetoichthys calabaricus TaxID=27687 RepID=A0A8C4XA40_ERPCA